jgi:tetratricopeptide (TPR) repeat protein
MGRLIRELRRREVFRTLGLYIGASWILIEVASVLVPAFEAPPWILRGLIIAAVAGFPVVAVLGWLFDVSEKGIRREADRPAAPAPAFLSRRMDFIVIGLLSVALTFSVYLNVAGRPDPPLDLQPISVLIADFQNSTGDEIFDDLLEQALAVGIEGAPHIMAFGRRDAEDRAGELDDDTDGLTAETSRLLAIREGVDLVLSGSIEPVSNGYRLSLEGIDPESGATTFEVSARAEGMQSVLAAVGTLSEAAREELGDPTLRAQGTATTETFTAGSIEAARAYITGTELAFDGKYEEAIGYFRTATELDPGFGRAYSGWATTEFGLGRTDTATELWQKAVSLLETMTEREQLRTLGLYYYGETRNYQKAVETFAELVEKYPADTAGRNNLAVTAFLSLDFETAAEQGRLALEMFPGSALYRANYALYSMYAGHFEAAAAAAGALIEDDPDYGSAYFPLAVARLVAGDFDGARDAYERMAAAVRTEHRESTATLGLADTLIYTGELQRAQQLLGAGIASDIDANRQERAATKKIALAETFLAEGQIAEAIAAATDALALSDEDSVRVAAAIVLLESGELEAASRIGDELSVQLNEQSRAYAMMIEAVVEREAGEYIDSVQTLRLAVELADLWRIRYELGRSYLAGGFFAEAFDEFDRCVERRGEATAMFLDDAPTFRYLADLPYWLGRAQEGLGMASSAAESYGAYLRLRPDGGPLADDARSRLQ